MFWNAEWPGVAFQRVSADVSALHWCISMTELNTGGDSSSTKRGLVDAKKVFESFRNSSEALKEQYPDPFETLGVDILANQKVYSQLAQ